MASWTRRSLCVLTFLPQVIAFTQCYYPYGSIPVDYVWEPCLGEGHSSCCIPTEGDICQPNGLCYYPLSNNTFRGACTDRTWNDPACAKDICVQGNEDTWAWSSPCADNGTNPSEPEAYACGTVSSKVKVTGLCPSTAQSTHYAFFVTTSTSTSNTKPTRYTSPPPLDTKKFSVYTETYTTAVSAWVQTTTFTTTWESTFTSSLAESTSTSVSKMGAGTGTANAAEVTSTISGAGKTNSGGITLSPGVLAAAIAAPIIGLGILAWLLFYLRAKRRLKRGDGAKSERLNSSGPDNGPVGAAQVVPYEVPATEAQSRPGTAIQVGGYYNSEKHGMTTFEKSGDGVYEMSGVGHDAVNDKNRFLSPQGSVREVWNTSPRSQHSVASANGNEIISPISPRSPAPTYTSAHGGAVELDDGSWNRQQPPQISPRPVGSNRHGVGNA